MSAFGKTPPGGWTEADRVPSVKQALARELAECRSYIVPDIPAGADATNDYWRRRVAALEAQS